MLEEILLDLENQRYAIEVMGLCEEIDRREAEARKIVEIVCIAHDLNPNEAPKGK